MAEVQSTSAESQQYPEPINPHHFVDIEEEMAFVQLADAAGNKVPLHIPPHPMDIELVAKVLADLPEEEVGVADGSALA